MSQLDLATLSGITPSTVGDIESARAGVTLRNALPLARALGINLMEDLPLGRVLDGYRLRPAAGVPGHHHVPFGQFPQIVNFHHVMDQEQPVQQAEGTYSLPLPSRLTFLPPAW